MINWGLCTRLFSGKGTDIQAPGSSCWGTLGDQFYLRPFGGAEELVTGIRCGHTDIAGTIRVGADRDLWGGLQTCARLGGKVHIVEEFAVLCSGHRLCDAYGIKVAASGSILRPGDDRAHGSRNNSTDDADDQHADHD